MLIAMRLHRRERGHNRLALDGERGPRSRASYVENLRDQTARSSSARRLVGPTLARVYIRNRSVLALKNRSVLAFWLLANAVLGSRGTHRADALVLPKTCPQRS